MGKKKTKTTKKKTTEADPGGLTDVQADKLARALHGTTKNIYIECPKVLGFEATDQTFDDLRAMGEIFRCKECSVWTGVDVESAVEGFCQGCDPDA